MFILFVTYRCISGTLQCIFHPNSSHQNDLHDGYKSTRRDDPSTTVTIPLGLIPPLYIAVYLRERGRSSCTPLWAENYRESWVKTDIERPHRIRAAPLLVTSPTNRDAMDRVSVQYTYLCTGGAYYVPYSCLLISNKFCNEGERPKQGEQVPLCTCSSNPLCEMTLAYRLDAISQSPRNSRIPGPNLLPLALVMDMHASKTLCSGLYKSKVHK